MLGWTLPADIADALNCEYATSFVGRQPAEIDLIVRVERRQQFEEVRRHPSQDAANQRAVETPGVIGVTRTSAVADTDTC